MQAEPTEPTGSTPAPRVPQIPPALADPRPVLAVGILAWAIATLVVWTSGTHWHDARPICLMGLAVGAAGYAIFWIQRRAARRGAKGAQQGLENA